MTNSCIFKNLIWNRTLAANYIRADWLVVIVKIRYLLIKDWNVHNFNRGILSGFAMWEFATKEDFENRYTGVILKVPGLPKNKKNDQKQNIFKCVLKLV